MQDFEYVAPKTLNEAVQLMAEKGSRARAMAGGTDILVQLRGGRFKIDRLVDIKGVPEMNQLSCSTAEGLTLGAAVPCYRIYEDQTIQKMYPGLVDAAFIIGGIQIQGRASVGGNLCNASPSGDTIPALIALGAICVIEGPKGRRTLPVEDFCVAPGKNAMEDGELLVALQFPPPAPRSGAHYLRFIPRNEMDIAVAGSGVSVVLDEDRQHIKSARISLAAVGPTPIFAREAGDLLAGKEANEESFEAAAEAAKAAARPITDMRGTIKQRVHLSGVLTKRALRKAVARAKEA
ncbi:MAG: xanthine dehydrogenase family protein subunit M [Chloroflexi bacterium]|nr:xanthine dehydrogenase family protein subunit M [Chloroflexota bacterium]